MRSIITLPVFSIILIIYVACNTQPVERPAIVMATDTLLIPFESLEFKAKGNDWEARLMTFTQPISLSIHYSDSGFFVYPKTKKGLIEGAGQICLTAGNDHFYYDLKLINQKDLSYNEVDYRSPKTVNLDSSIHHQKIRLAKDEWSNLVPLDETSELFEEEELSLPYEIGVYRAIKNVPLSAYYVQSGSCTFIPIQWKFLKERSVYIAIVGPLKDEYANIVSDGTLVTFIYYDGHYTHRIETALLKGFANVEIPIHHSNPYTLYAQVNETVSSTIKLTPI